MPRLQCVGVLLQGVTPCQTHTRSLTTARPVGDGRPSRAGRYSQPRPVPAPAPLPVRHTLCPWPICQGRVWPSLSPRPNRWSNPAKNPPPILASANLWGRAENYGGKFQRQFPCVFLSGRSSQGEHDRHCVYGVSHREGRG